MGTLGIGLLVLAIALFIPSLILKHTLYKYVSREKVLGEHDLCQLWKYSIPPRRILNEQGKRIYHYSNIGMGMCFVCVILLLLYISLFVMR